MCGLCLSNNLDMSSVSPVYTKMSAQDPLRFLSYLTDPRQISVVHQYRDSIGILPSMWISALALKRRKDYLEYVIRNDIPAVIFPILKAGVRV